MSIIMQLNQIIYGVKLVKCCKYESCLQNLDTLEKIICALMDKYRDDECKLSVLKEIRELKLGAKK